MAVETLDGIENAVYEADPVEHREMPDVLCSRCRGIGDVEGENDLMPCPWCGGSGITLAAREFAPMDQLRVQRDILLNARESELRQREAKRIAAGGQRHHATDLMTLMLMDESEAF